MLTNWSGLQAREGKTARDVSVKAMSMGSWKADKSKGGSLHIPKSGSPAPRKRGKRVLWMPPPGGWPAMTNMNPLDYNRLGRKGSM